MSEQVEDMGTLYGLARAAELASHLSTATSRVEKVSHADIEKDDFRKVITEFAGGQGTRDCK